jgi:ATP-dependent RNA helicase DeaD
MVSVEFNRFINYYKETEIYLLQSEGSDDREPKKATMVRYFVNIGSRDNFDWMSLKIKRNIRLRS